MALSNRARFRQWCRRTFGDIRESLYGGWLLDSEALKEKYRQRSDSCKPFGWSTLRWNNFRKEFGRMRIRITDPDGRDILLPEIKARKYGQ